MSIQMNELFSLPCSKLWHCGFPLQSDAYLWLFSHYFEIHKWPVHYRTLFYLSSNKRVFQHVYLKSNKYRHKVVVAFVPTDAHHRPFWQTYKYIEIPIGILKNINIPTYSQICVGYYFDLFTMLLWKYSSFKTNLINLLYI